MSINLHVTMEVREGALGAFNTWMAKAVGLLEKQGWKLESAFIQRTGRLNTVIHIWELESFEHFGTGGRGYSKEPEFAEVRAKLDELMLSETIVFMSRSPYARRA